METVVKRLSLDLATKNDVAKEIVEIINESREALGSIFLVTETDLVKSYDDLEQKESLRKGSQTLTADDKKELWSKAIVLEEKGDVRARAELLAQKAFPPHQEEDAHQAVEHWAEHTHLKENDYREYLKILLEEMRRNYGCSYIEAADPAARDHHRPDVAVLLRHRRRGRRDHR